MKEGADGEWDLAEEVEEGGGRLELKGVSVEDLRRLLVNLRTSLVSNCASVG